MCHWVLNLLLYVNVREKHIRTITIKIFTETGKQFSISNNVVISRINFRRRPFLT